MKKNKPIKILLIASSGGHLDQLYSLKPFWKDFDRHWVTFDTVHGRGVLVGESKVTWAYSPTNRNVYNLLRNLILAYKIIARERFTHIISTGAGVGVPFIWMGKLFGAKTVFIDSFTRTQNISLSARLVYYVSDVVMTQWTNNTQKYKRLIYKGKVI